MLQPGEAAEMDLVLTVPADLPLGYYGLDVRGKLTFNGTGGARVQPFTRHFSSIKVEERDRDDDLRPDSQDAFPDDSTETTDTDHDGVGNNKDDFPLDPAASLDTDGDRTPDAWNPGRSKENSTTGLVLDAYPNDPRRWKKEPGFTLWDALIIAAVILLLLSIAVFALSFTLSLRIRAAGGGQEGGKGPKKARPAKKAGSRARRQKGKRGRSGGAV
jgi:hypothetical protein